MFTLCRGQYNQQTRNELHSIPVTPRGKRSNRWLGLQHGEFIERIIELLKTEFGKLPGPEQYIVSPNQAVLIGGFELANSDGSPFHIPNVPHQSTYCFGVRHSNDSRFAIEGAAGGRVFVCENGIMSGDDQWKHKHTTGFRLKEFIVNGLRKFWERVQKLPKIINLFSNTKYDLLRVRWNDFLTELARKNIIPWRLLGDLERETVKAYSNTQHPFHAENFWSIYNHITETIKQLAPSVQYESLRKAIDFIAGYLPPTELDEYNTLQGTVITSSI